MTNTYRVYAQHAAAQPTAQFRARVLAALAAKRRGPVAR